MSSRGRQWLCFSFVLHLLNFFFRSSENEDSHCLTIPDRRWSLSACSVINRVLEVEVNG